MKIDIMKLPLGTRFFVENGLWYGRIAGSHNAKSIFVEKTRETHPLTKELVHGLDISLAKDE